MFIGAAGQVVPVKVNAEKEGAPVAKQYNVHGYPTILFIDPSDGKVVSKIVGYLPAKQFAGEIGLASEIYSGLPPLLQRVQTHPDDANALEMVALVKSKQGKLSESEQLIGQAEKLDPKGSKGPLSTACLEVAEAYEGLNDKVDVEKYLDKTLLYTTDPFERTVANLYLAQNHTQTGDKATALKEVQAVIDDKYAPDYLKEFAEAMQKQLKK